VVKEYHPFGVHMGSKPTDSFTELFDTAAVDQLPSEILDELILHSSQIAGIQTDLSDRAIQRTFDVKSPPYNAVGNGIVDDLDAIQAAIDAAFAAGGGIVDLAFSTYGVKPSGTRWIYLRPNVHIYGKKAKIKVLSSTGNYKTIFQSQSGALLNNIHIDNIIFDQNPSGNTGCDVDPNQPTTVQWVFYFPTIPGVAALDNIKITNCEFNPTSAYNSIAIAGGNATNIVIDNCKFNFIRAHSTTGYDVSSIFVDAIGYHITNNLLITTISQKAPTAIEVHGVGGTIQSNFVDSYQTGCILQASAPNSSGATRNTSDTTITGNTFTSVDVGVWFTGNSMGSPTVALRNVIISDNAISLAQADHGLSFSAGIANYWPSGPVAADISGLSITGNIISFQTPDAHIVDANGVAIDAPNCAGITLRPWTDLRNFVVSGNTIRNAPVCGISLGGTVPGSLLRNGLITDNVLIDCGRNRSLPNQLYCCDFLVNGYIAAVRIENNFLVDTAISGLNGLYGLTYYPSGTPTDVTFIGNKRVTGSGATIADTTDGVHSPIKDLVVDGSITATTFYGNVPIPSVDASPVSRSYILSRSQNLVTNGSGLLATNYNFSGFTFDAIETHGGAGSFKKNVAFGTIYNDEFIPVDVTKYYRLIAWGKSGNADGSSYNLANTQYLGISLYDIDQLLVDPHYYSKTTGSTDTTLSAQLNPGDTTFHLTDATGWYNGSGNFWERQFVWWPYINSKGYSYPVYTYSRNWTGDLSADISNNGLWAAGGISGTTITLRGPWAGPILPSGTKVRNSTAGPTFKYLAANGVAVLNSWTKYEGSIGDVDSQGAQILDKFPYGTAFIKLLFLTNYHGAADNTIRWSDIWFSELDPRNLGLSGGGGGADALGTYVVKTSTNAPANAQVLASLATGVLKVTTGTGVLSTAVAGTDYVVPSGSITGTAANITGTVALANGGTNANLSSTGGVGQYLKQSASGATVTVGTIPSADVPNLDAAKITTGVPTGVLKGAAGVFASAVVGTDFLTPTGSGTSLTGVPQLVSRLFLLAQGVDAAAAQTTNPIRVKRAHTLVSARAICVTAPSSPGLTLTIEKSTNGGSTWTDLWAGTTANRPTIAAGATDGTDAGAFDSTTGAAGTWYRGKVVTAGSTTAGQTITLELEYTLTYP
jgi:hypothetical protein